MMRWVGLALCMVLLAQSEAAPSWTQVLEEVGTIQSLSSTKMQLLAKAAEEDAVKYIGDNKVHVSQLATKKTQTQLCGGAAPCIVACNPLCMRAIFESNYTDGATPTEVPTEVPRNESKPGWGARRKIPRSSAKGSEKAVQLSILSLSASEKAVNAVWSDMKKWGKSGPAKRGGADLAMYMQENTMSMDATQFTMNGGSDKQMDSTFGDPPSSNSKVQQRSWTAGALSFKKFVKGNSMTMTKTNLTTNGKASYDARTVVGAAKAKSSVPLTQLALSQLAGRQQSGQSQVDSSAQNMYMYGNELAMQKTIFTMNVGTGSGTTGRRLLSSGSNAVSVDTLNINMYMHDNKMVMDGTKFEMNAANSMLKSPRGRRLLSVANKGIGGADLTRLILLEVAWVLGSEARTITSTDKPSVPDDVNSVWSWLRSWDPDARSAGEGSVDINIYMSNNSMSMDGTEFSFNVGSSGQQSTADSSAAQTEKLSPTSKKAPAPAPPDKYMYSEGRTMTNTVFQMDVKKPQEEAVLTKLQQGGQGGWKSLNMYMANNKMSMAETVFTMNIGAGSSLNVGQESIQESLLQGISSDDSARTSELASQPGKTINVKSLNVKMYMYKNNMAMKNTVFTMNVK